MRFRSLFFPLHCRCGKWENKDERVVVALNVARTSTRWCKLATRSEAKDFVAAISSLFFQPQAQEQPIEKSHDEGKSCDKPSDKHSKIIFIYFAFSPSISGPRLSAISFSRLKANANNERWRWKCLHVLTLVIPFRGPRFPKHADEPSWRKCRSVDASESGWIRDENPICKQLLNERFASGFLWSFELFTMPRGYEIIIICCNVSACFRGDLLPINFLSLRVKGTRILRESTESSSQDVQRHWKRQKKIKIRSALRRLED